MAYHDSRDSRGNSMEAFGYLVSQINPSHVEKFKYYSSRSPKSSASSNDKLMEVLASSWGLPSSGHPYFPSPTRAEERFAPIKESPPKESTALVAQRKLTSPAKVEVREYEPTNNLVKEVREGPIPLRVCGAIGGVGMIATGILSFTIFRASLTTLEYVVQVYNIFFGLVVFALETRIFFKFLFKKLGITEYARFLNVIWGRGLFYIYSGTLILGSWNLIGWVLGSYIIFVGFIAFVFGCKTSYHISAYKDQLSTDEEIYQIFSHFDEDRRGILNSQQMGALLAEMGAELSDGELRMAIKVLDRNRDGYIQFSEFASWWRAFRSDSFTSAAMTV